MEAPAPATDVSPTTPVKSDITDQEDCLMKSDGEGHERHLDERIEQDDDILQERMRDPVEDETKSCATNANAASAPSVAATEEHQIQAFAKLEFADGDFYMTTYAIELGRDPAAPTALNSEAWGMSNLDAKTLGDDSIVESLNLNNEQISGVKLESGAIEEPSNLQGRTNDQDITEARMEDNSSIISASNPSVPAMRRRDYNALAMSPVRNLGGDEDMDEFNLVAPLDCPLIPIQQPINKSTRRANGKSISRRHIRISFNFEKHYFEILFLGRNGGFLDDEWFASSDIQPLVNGSVIQIGGLGIRFVLPDVAPGETGADEIRQAQESEIASMSDNEDSSDGSNSEIEGRWVRARQNTDSADEDDEIDQEDELSARDHKPGRRGRKPKVKIDLNMDKQQRKGPGRPRKNGPTSRPEQNQSSKTSRELKASRRSEDKARSRDVKSKDKVKSSKSGAKAEEPESTENTAPVRRKYKKRKNDDAEDDAPEGNGTSERTGSMAPDATAAPAKPAKERRPPKPPRSPSPVWDESKLTEEQLAKPQASYVILIHEALTNSKTGAMSLPQIYRAIERKYPYFKLKVTTQGWQSSVRHNLGQHPAFRKIERDGKGWLWGYDPEISIEKDKKRRSTPPPTQSRYYPSSANIDQTGNRPAEYPYANVRPLPNGAPSSHPHPHPHPHVSAPPPPSHGQRPGMPANTVGPRPPFPASGFPIILNANSESTYRSPYERDSQSDTVPAEPSSRAGNNPNSSSAMPSHHNHTPGVASGKPPYRAPHPPAIPPHSSNPSNSGPAHLQQPQKWQPKPGGPHARPVGSGPPHPPGRRQLSQAAIETINKFKQAMMNSMTDKAYAARLIESAIERTLSPNTPSKLTDVEDLRSEQQIMTALERMLSDVEAETARRAANAARMAAANAKSAHPRPSMGPGGERNHPAGSDPSRAPRPNYPPPTSSSSAAPPRPPSSSHPGQSLAPPPGRGPPQPRPSGVPPPSVASGSGHGSQGTNTSAARSTVPGPHPNLTRNVAQPLPRPPPLPASQRIDTTKPPINRGPHFKAVPPPPTQASRIPPGPANHPANTAPSIPTPSAPAPTPASAPVPPPAATKVPTPASLPNNGIKHPRSEGPSEDRSVTPRPEKRLSTAQKSQAPGTPGNPP